jgi:hypothetical protein
MASIVVASCSPTGVTERLVSPDIEVVVYLWEMHGARSGHRGCPETAGLNSPHKMRVELSREDGIQYWRNSPGPSKWHFLGHQVPLISEMIREADEDFEVHICGWDAQANFVFPVLADISEAANRERVPLTIKHEFRTGPFVYDVTKENGNS